MADRTKSSNHIEENHIHRSSKIVCCAHGRRCNRNQLPVLLQKECVAVSRKCPDRPKREQRYELCQPKISNGKNAQRKRRSYFKEQNLFDTVSQTPTNTEISVTSLLLPAFSQMTINFEHADAKKCEKFNGGVQAVGLRGQPYIANEKIRPQQYQEEKKDVMSKALLKEMYIGCKTAEGAEKVANSPSKFCLYHRKQSGSDISQLLKPLPLYLLYTRSNREFLHKAVQAVDVVDSGVQVLVDASEDAEAATPFPNSSEMSVTSSISHTSSSSRNSSFNERSGWVA